MIGPENNVKIPPECTRMHHFTPWKYKKSGGGPPYPSRTPPWGRMGSNGISRQLVHVPYSVCVFPLNIFSIMGSGDHQKKAKINSFYSSHIEKFQKEAFKGHQIEPQDCL